MYAKRSTAANMSNKEYFGIDWEDIPEKPYKETCFPNIGAALEALLPIKSALASKLAILTTKTGERYFFHNSAAGGISFNPFSRDFFHEVIYVEQILSPVSLLIAVARDGIPKKEVRCTENSAENKLNWVSVNGESFSGEASINYNRLKRGLPLSEHELELICKGFGYLYPRSREFVEACTEFRLLDFGEPLRGPLPEVSEADSARALAIPEAWSFSAEEWESKTRAAKAKEEVAVAEMDRRDDERWLKFKELVETEIRSHCGPINRILINHDFGSVSHKKPGKGLPERWEFNLPDEAFNWNDYEDEFKSYLVAPTAVTATLLAIDHNENAYLRIQFKDAIKEDKYKFKVGKDGARKLPMYLAHDLQRGKAKLYDAAVEFPNPA